VRKPRGFSAPKVPFGVLFVKTEDDGGWVILAGEPDVKIDNKHMDRRPHIHVGGWLSDDRRPLRFDLTVAEAARAIRSQLSNRGRLDVADLIEELS